MMIDTKIVCSPVHMSSVERATFKIYSMLEQFFGMEYKNFTALLFLFFFLLLPELNEADERECPKKASESWGVVRHPAVVPPNVPFTDDDGHKRSDSQDCSGCGSSQLSSNRSHTFQSPTLSSNKSPTRTQPLDITSASSSIIPLSDSAQYGA